MTARVSRESPATITSHGLAIDAAQNRRLGGSWDVRSPDTGGTI